MIPKMRIIFFIFAHCVAFEKLVSELHEFFFQVTLGGRGQIYQSKTSKTGIFSTIIEWVPLGFFSCTN